MSKYHEFLTYLVPVATEQGATGRQGLQRLLLLRSFVAVVGILGLLAFQSIFGIVVSYTLITSLSIAILVSVALGGIGDYKNPRLLAIPNYSVTY